MKILHTSDWHIGKRLESFSRLQEQKEVLEEICDIAQAQDVDAVVIAGDLFDTFNPPAEAVELFYKTLKKLANNGQRPVICIAGNHDSPERIEAPEPLARECGIFFAGYPNSHINSYKIDSGLSISKSEPGFIEINIPQCPFPLRILLMPYANEARLKMCLQSEDTNSEMCDIIKKNWQGLADKYCDSNGVNILLQHLFMIQRGGQTPEEPEDEKPILHVGGAQAVYTDMIPAQIQYAATGHLHRPMTVSGSPCPVIYSGSPLAYSFGEADQDKFVYIADLQPGEKVKVDKILLSKGKRLLRQTFSDIDQAIGWLKEHSSSLVEITIEADNYINAADKTRLYAAHEGIITLIPQIKSFENPNLGTTNIDLSKHIKELFVDYFKSRQSQQLPNQELLDLFTEILAEEEK